MSKKVVIRKARELKYLQDVKGILKDATAVDPEDESSALELWIEGQDKAIYMPRNWYPDFDLEIGMEVHAYWDVKDVPDRETGEITRRNCFNLELVVK